MLKIDRFETIKDKCALILGDGDIECKADLKSQCLDFRNKGDESYRMTIMFKDVESIDRFIDSLKELKIAALK